MTHKKFGNQYVLRFFSGEEVKESIRLFCHKKRLTNVWFFGIGAVGECDLNVFDIKNKRYTTKKFKKQLEIASLQGNVTAGGAVHMHAVLSDHAMRAIGGHLERAVVSVTAEIILMPLPNILERAYDTETGLNLLNLE